MARYGIICWSNGYPSFERMYHNLSARGSNGELVSAAAVALGGALVHYVREGPESETFEHQLEEIDELLGRWRGEGRRHVYLHQEQLDLRVRAAVRRCPGIEPRNSPRNSPSDHRPEECGVLRSRRDLLERAPLAPACAHGLVSSALNDTSGTAPNARAFLRGEKFRRTPRSRESTRRCARPSLPQRAARTCAAATR